MEKLEDYSFELNGGKLQFVLKLNVQELRVVQNALKHKLYEIDVDAPRLNNKQREYRGMLQAVQNRTLDALDTLEVPRIQAWEVNVYD